MGSIKRRVLSAIGLSDPCHPIVLKYQGWRRKVLRTDRRIAHDYMKDRESPMLHLGASNHLLEGWLNTDIFSFN